MRTTRFFAFGALTLLAGLLLACAQGGQPTLSDIADPGDDSSGGDGGDPPAPLKKDSGIVKDSGASGFETGAGMENDAGNAQDSATSNDADPPDAGTDAGTDSGGQDTGTDSGGGGQDAGHGGTSQGTCPSNPFYANEESAAANDPNAALCFWGSTCQPDQCCVGAVLLIPGFCVGL